MKKDFIVAFHIGRGGKYHNPGNRTFNPYIERLSDCFNERCIIYEQDEYGNPLPDEQWQLIDGGGNVILEGRDKIESDTGILDWDGEYNTDIVKYLSECSDCEIDIIYQTYLDDKYMDSDLKDYICTKKGLHRIHRIEFKDDSAILKCQSGILRYNWYGNHDITEEEIKEWMAEQNIDPISIENNAWKFESHFYKD